jgi:putative tryptophan/tyrosine transport system substrate-binding protein
MRRREFIKIIAGSAAAAWPLAVHAQQPSMPVVGFLHVASAGPFGGIVAGFRQGMQETGFTEGQNVAIEFRWAEGHYDRLPALAAELVRRQVAVIVTGGGEATALAAKAATPTIPIVSNFGSDPVKMGFVASLSRPAGNITGVNILTTELPAKRVGLLHDLVPTSSIIGHLVNPNYPPTEVNVNDVEAAARVLGLKIVLLKASSNSDIDAAFVSMRGERVGALLVGADPVFNSRRDQIVALAARGAIPAIYEQREFVAAGGLMSYGTSLTDSYRQMGSYAGRILKGEKPGDLPIVQSAKFELVVNLKAAKTLGLTVPQGLLNAADEVIE